jgi:3-oxoacyl-[acyl-carrier protein] reductase
MVDLDGKRAIVCGSTQGIGLACARELARLGAEVHLLARSEESLARACGTLDRSRGQSHSTLRADFDEPDQVREAVRAHVESRPAVHILVNNTGGPPGGPMFEAEPAAFTRAFAQHLICNQILVQALVPGMKELGYGRILNIISTSIKQPIRGLGVSNTVRGAVASWAKTLAEELGPFGITVNNVLPGATLTGRLKALIATWAQRAGVTDEEMQERMKREIPLRRFAEPEEVAAAVCFLASPAAAYVNGINLPVDGGRTLSL